MTSKTVLATLGFVAGFAMPAAFAAPVERTLTVPGFTAVMTAGVDVSVTVGPATSLVVTGEPAELAKLEVVVEKGELKLQPKRKGWYNGSGSLKGISARVTTPSLAEASIAGSGSMTATGINAKNFEVSIGGSGSFTGMDAKVDKADLSIGGSGSITMSGACKTADISIGGSGKVRAAALKCSKLDVSIGGSGDVEAYASDAADTSIAGGGDVMIYGNPKKRDKSIAGGGNVTYPAK
jgi:Putative auto-transporter adhesin, head GIN domain